MMLTLSQVHERSIESDFLLIVLRSLIERRKDLKYVEYLSSSTVLIDRQSGSHVCNRRLGEDIAGLSLV